MSKNRWLRNKLEKINPYILVETFALGESFEALHRISAGMNVRGDGGLLETLNILADNWEAIRLTLGTDDFDYIEDKCERWSKLLRKKYKRRNRLIQDDAENIRRDFTGDREMYLLRLHSTTVIPIVERKMLDNGKLRDGPQEFFERKDTWDSLSREIKEDLASATICLLVGEWTPAVMVMLRAAEEAVSNYYKFKTNSSIRCRFNDMIDKLSKRIDANKALVGHLDFIRKRRNEAAHPGKRFSSYEAERTFIQVIDALIEMEKDMDLCKGATRDDKTNGRSRSL